MSLSYKNPKQFIPCISVNCILFGYTNQELMVLLIDDAKESDGKHDLFALPEDLIGDEESLEQAADRILFRDTGLKDIDLKQFHAFGNPNRLKIEPDIPSNKNLDRKYSKRVITVSYFSLLNLETNKKYSQNTSGVWHPVNQLPNLAFDHSEIIKNALDFLRTSFLNFQCNYSYLLPKKFTLSALQNLYEVILGQKMDKRNFRKVIHTKPFLKQLRSLEKGLAHRPARLYSYKKITL